MRRLGGFRREDRGATLVEFALVAPIVILVLVACLDFARALNAYVTIANASREGARYASVHPAADPSDIAGSVAARIAPLDPASLSVTASYYDPVRGLWPAWPVGGLPPSQFAPAPIAIRVTTTYPWQASTWVIGALFGAAGSRTFGSSSVSEAVR